MTTRHKPLRTQYERDANAICRIARLELEWDSSEEKASTTGAALDQLSDYIKSKSGIEYVLWTLLDSGFIGSNRITRRKGYWESISRFNIPGFERIDKIESIREKEGYIKFICAIQSETIDSGVIANIIRSAPCEAQVFMLEKAQQNCFLETIGECTIHHKMDRVAEDTIALLCRFNAFAFEPYGWFDDCCSGGAYLARQEIVDQISNGLL